MSFFLVIFRPQVKRRTHALFLSLHNIQFFSSCVQLSLAVYMAKENKEECLVYVRKCTYRKTFFYCSARAREKIARCVYVKKHKKHTFLNYYYPVMCMRNNTTRRKKNWNNKKKLYSSLKEVKKQVNNNKMSVLWKIFASLELFCVLFRESILIFSIHTSRRSLLKLHRVVV